MWQCPGAAREVLLTDAEEALAPHVERNAGDVLAPRAPVQVHVSPRLAGPVTEADSIPWHATPPSDVLVTLESTAKGLGTGEAAARLARHGRNALDSAPPRSAASILVDQFRSVMVLLLIVAAAVAFATGDVIDAIAIAGVLIINSSIGFITEFRARRAMHALLQLEVSRATVLRDGERSDIDARDVVPGDVIELEAGQGVPADARLLATTELSATEAALTGESLPVPKRADAERSADTLLSERDTMVYKATTIATGRGRAVVVATGHGTEVGRIGKLVQGVKETRTPLEHHLNELGHRLIWVTIAAVGAVVAVGLLRGEPLAGMLEIGITLAVAAVPEGLLAIATITMAVGVHRMARRRASIRRLPVVETLGAVTVVCTDKTGTLTTGEMTATTLWVAGQEYAITGVGYGAAGDLLADGAPVSHALAPVLERAFRTATLANRADVVTEDGRTRPVGDPTEAALIVAARKVGIERSALLLDWPEVGEIPFSSERQLMATFHRGADGNLVAYVKGASGRLFALSDRMLTADGHAPLGDAERAILRATNDELAARGLRVLALASGVVSAPTEAALGGLTFAGFVGIVDPPAPHVRETIARFREAGIRTVMLTGDQRLTAGAIARQLGLVEREDEVVDGREIAALSDPELTTRLVTARAMSRVSPADKLRVVDALQATGAVVAMLGDGVNDAPALKKANVGIAMGGRGTDVAKEAASVVLQDDRFETIAVAIEEGRVIFANIRKFVFYLFSCNLAEVLVLLIAGIVGLPIPLLPLQILWLNLVTDTFPALALALEPAESDVMRRPPNDPRAALLSRDMIGSIAFYGALMTAATLAAFLWALTNPERSDKAVTMSFLTLSLAQVFHLGNARSATPVLAWRSVVRNRYALGAVALTIALQALALHLPVLSRILRTQPLTLGEWLAALGFAAVPAVVGQSLKLWRGRRAVR